MSDRYEWSICDDGKYWVHEKVQGELLPVCEAVNEFGAARICDALNGVTISIENAQRLSQFFPDDSFTATDLRVAIDELQAAMEERLHGDNVSQC